MGLSCRSCYFQLDAGVDEGRHEIGQKVAQHDGAGRDHGDAHDDRDVDALDGLPGQLADAGPAEHAFHNDDAAHEDADVDADHGHDGQDRVRQRVAQDHAAAREALGAGGADIVLTQHVDHARAHHPAVPARAEDPERDGGQHKMRERAVAADGEPAELDREDIEEEQAHHELRCRDRDEGDDHQPLIERPSAPEGCDDAHGQAQHQLAQDRAAHQLQGGGQARRDQRRHIGLLQVAAPEIALHEPPRDSDRTARGRAGRDRAGGGCSRPPAAWPSGPRSGAPDRPAAHRAG